MAGSSAGAGVLTSLMAVGLFAVLGSLFDVTTRLQLMELAQLNAPLLRRLQEEAPGTFHHSVLVGNLAERAADKIGADSLLVRVGAYYHDIGRSEQHTSELQSRQYLVCRLLLEKKTYDGRPIRRATVLT